MARWRARSPAWGRRNPPAPVHTIQRGTRHESDVKLWHLATQAGLLALYSKRVDPRVYRSRQLRADLSRRLVKQRSQRGAYRNRLALAGNDLRVFVDAIDAKLKMQVRAGARPVAPTAPTFWPCATLWPRRTVILLRWAYTVWCPRWCVTITTLPKPFCTARKFHHAITHTAHRGASGCGVVHAQMCPPCFQNGVKAHLKAAGDARELPGVIPGRRAASFRPARCSSRPWCAGWWQWRRGSAGGS